MSISPMKNWFETNALLLACHRRTVTATVVSVTGSAPRKAGAKMTVLPDGTSEGTIGGGELERRAAVEAAALFASREPKVVRYSLHPEPDGSGASICGGEADVYFELHEASPRLLVYGAGHCGRALLLAGVPLGFRPAVADDREDLLGELSALPGLSGVETYLLDPGLGRGPSVQPDDRVVIMTRSHDLDTEILRSVIRCPAVYMGMIASQTKARQIRAALAAEGFTPEELGRVHMPVGLPIRSETPAEIAVSVLAQIVSLKPRFPER